MVIENGSCGECGGCFLLRFLSFRYIIYAHIYRFGAGVLRRSGIDSETTRGEDLVSVV